MSLAEVLSKAPRADGGLRGANLNGGPLGGFRNKLINGDFGLWQRGTLFTTTSGYTADRWRVSGSLASSLQTTQQAFTLGQTEVPGNPTYFIRLQRLLLAELTLRQKIEDVRTLAGKRVTVTFYLRGSSAGSLSAILRQDFGTGGSPSASADHLVAVSVTTAWTKISFSVDLASLAGKTLGSVGDHNLTLILVFPTTVGNATSYIDVARVSVVEGDATGEDDPFSRRHIQQELSLCQRYFYKSYPQHIAPGTPSAVDVSNSAMEMFSPTGLRDEMVVSLRFPVEMRSLPAVVIYSPWSGASGYCGHVGGTNDDIAASVIGGSSQTGARLRPDTSPGGTNYRAWLHVTADAEL
ncbi:hypothetical protein EHS39_09065 [Ensifer sp. MPMI2T]|nr:hypothetical protein EHS39_09065 [Ensifer sp. MPMI2T]